MFSERSIHFDILLVVKFFVGEFLTLLRNLPSCNNIYFLVEGRKLRNVKLCYLFFLLLSQIYDTTQLIFVNDGIPVYKDDTIPECSQPYLERVMERDKEEGT